MVDDRNTQHRWNDTGTGNVEVNVKFSLKPTMKAQRVSNGVALLFL